MPKATITYKGQITLPKAVREQLGVRPGDRISFREIEGGAIVVEADTVDLMDLKGILRSRISGVTVEQMNQTIRDSAARER